MTRTGCGRGPVEYPRPDGSIAGDQVSLVDLTTVDANDWLLLNQFSVSESSHCWRPDLVAFLNLSHLPFLPVGSIMPGRQIIA